VTRPPLARWRPARRSPEPPLDELVRFLARTRDCWWTAARIAAVVPRLAQSIESRLETCWRLGHLRRKRGPRGLLEYQARFPEGAR
jgi:hypothetical protein